MHIYMYTARPHVGQLLVEVPELLLQNSLVSLHVLACRVSMWISARIISSIYAYVCAFIYMHIHIYVYVCMYVCVLLGLAPCSGLQRISVD
jgi:hypothetical protein